MTVRFRNLIRVTQITNSKLFFNKTKIDFDCETKKKIISTYEI